MNWIFIRIHDKTWRNSCLNLSFTAGNIQRDGLFGSLIVRTPPEMEPNIHTYDFDLPSHTIDIADWHHLPSDTYWPGYSRNQSFVGDLPKSLLINGRGSYSVWLNTSDHFWETDDPKSPYLQTNWIKLYKIIILVAEWFYDCLGCRHPKPKPH